jgi:hypothetical protein
MLDARWLLWLPRRPGLILGRHQDDLFPNATPYRNQCALSQLVHDRRERLRERLQRAARSRCMALSARLYGPALCKDVLGKATNGAYMCGGEPGSRYRVSQGIDAPIVSVCEDGMGRVWLLL